VSRPTRLRGWILVQFVAHPTASLVLCEPGGSNDHTDAYVKIEANLGYSPVEPDDHVRELKKALQKLLRLKIAAFDDAVICWRSTASTTTSLRKQIKP